MVIKVRLHMKNRWIERFPVYKIWTWVIPWLNKQEAVKNYDRYDYLIFVYTDEVERMSFKIVRINGRKIAKIKAPWHPEMDPYVSFSTFLAMFDKSLSEIVRIYTEKFVTL